jgi:hypothetical protein
MVSKDLGKLRRVAVTTTAPIQHQRPHVRVSNPSATIHSIAHAQHTPCCSPAPIQQRPHVRVSNPSATIHSTTKAHHNPCCSPANTTKTPYASVQSKCNHPQQLTNAQHNPLLFPCQYNQYPMPPGVQSKCNHAPGCPIQVQPSTAVNQCTTKAQHNPCCVHVYMFTCLHVYRRHRAPHLRRVAGPRDDHDARPEPLWEPLCLDACAREVAVVHRRRQVRVVLGPHHVEKGRVEPALDQRQAEGGQGVDHPGVAGHNHIIRGRDVVQRDICRRHSQNHITRGRDVVQRDMQVTWPGS